MLSRFSSDAEIKPQRRFDESHEAVLVFGLSDRRARVLLEAGEVKDERYSAQWTDMTPVFYGSANKGFVLVKVPADTPIAITGISMENRWKQFWSGGPFQTCKGQTVVVFQVPKGKVLYFSDFNFRQDGRALFFDVANNYSGAQSYVDTNFPELTGRLQPATFVSLPRADDCQKMARRIESRIPETPETASR